MSSSSPSASAPSAMDIVLTVLLMISVYLLWRLACWSPSPAHALPRDYAFSSSTAVRALETTRLVYTAPGQPDLKRFTPVIFRVFDRVAGPAQRYVKTWMYGDLAYVPF